METAGRCRADPEDSCFRDLTGYAWTAAVTQERRHSPAKHSLLSGLLSACEFHLFPCHLSKPHPFPPGLVVLSMKFILQIFETRTQKENEDELLGSGRHSWLRPWGWCHSAGPAWSAADTGRTPQLQRPTAHADSIHQQSRTLGVSSDSSVPSTVP